MCGESCGVGVSVGNPYTEDSLLDVVDLLSSPVLVDL